MTKEVLIQYADMHQEIKDLRKRIEVLEEKQQSLRDGGTVIDTVRGTRQDGTFGSIRIEGFPSREYNKRKAAIEKYWGLLVGAETQLLELLNDAEEFIESIPDSHLRLIIRLRIIDDLSWRQVAQRIGGGNTEDGVRKAFDRFFDDTK